MCRSAEHAYDGFLCCARVSACHAVPRCCTCPVWQVHVCNCAVHFAVHLLFRVQVIPAHDLLGCLCFYLSLVAFVVCFFAEPIWFATCAYMCLCSSSLRNSMGWLCYQRPAQAYKHALRCHNLQDSIVYHCCLVLVTTAANICHTQRLANSICNCCSGVALTGAGPVLWLLVCLF